MNSIKEWWKADAYRRWLLIGGFVYAWFFGQGIPLWDDDFTSWFWKIKDQSLFTTLFQWISPISTQPQYWGFNERPVQALVYQVFHLISGYDSWSYFAYKSLVYGGLGVMIYLWALRLVPASELGSKQGISRGNLAAFAAAAFFLLAPGPMAAHVIHSDLATTAELWFLVSTYLIWQAVEDTPSSWTGLPSLGKPEQKQWLLRWAGIAVFTYLGYKSKADLKLIPVILAAYVLVVRRKQWKLFAAPAALLVFLAVPWGGAIFRKLPPFMPGSQGSEIGWMWQPASFERLFDFIWTRGTYSFLSSLKDPTLSLAGLLGPFLLVGALAFLGWRAEALDKVRWGSLESRQDRARVFVLIWFGIVLAGISALPGLNYIFRIRYGILTMVPVSLLLAWVFGLFAESVGRKERSLPRWAMVAGVAVLSIQSAMNLNRSIHYRRDLGQVMVSVDQAYEHVTKNFPSEKLTLFPDFRPYDYRPDAPSAILNREWLSKPEDLVSKHQPYKAYAISWKPSLWPAMEMVAHFPGCRETTVFDRLFPCPAGTGTYLMRYIGEDPLYKQAEEARSRGDTAAARRLHEEFLAKHPQSLAGHFVVGLLAYQAQDWARAQQSYAAIERYLPDHTSVLYNHALALAQTGQYDPAIERLRFIVAREPANYAALINLYWAYAKGKQPKKATKLLVQMKKQFPEDAEVNRLLASDPSVK